MSYRHVEGTWMYRDEIPRDTTMDIQLGRFHAKWTKIEALHSRGEFFKSKQGPWVSESLSQWCWILWNDIYVEFPWNPIQGILIQILYFVGQWISMIFIHSCYVFEIFYTGEFRRHFVLGSSFEDKIWQNSKKYEISKILWLCFYIKRIQK